MDFRGQLIKSSSEDDDDDLLDNDVFLDVQPVLQSVRDFTHTAVSQQVDDM